MAKLRASTVAGEVRKVSASRSRPHKPPAKELSRRKAAALSSGGGKLPPRIREELDREPMPKRVRATPAKDGPATVQLCQELLPDVLVLDEDMPGADGLRVLKYLRRELPDIKVVMYTLDGDVCQAARTLGAVACVMKDARYEVLLRAIREAAPAYYVPSELN